MDPVHRGECRNVLRLPDVADSDDGHLAAVALVGELEGGSRLTGDVAHLGPEQRLPVLRRAPSMHLRLHADAPERPSDVRRPAAGARSFARPEVPRDVSEERDQGSAGCSGGTRTGWNARASASANSAAANEAAKLGREAVKDTDAGCVRSTSRVHQAGPTGESH